jgi:hypothetical protein
MFAIDDFNGVVNFLDTDLDEGKLKFVGFVFAPPRTDVGQQIQQRIFEYNFRFGRDLHFFLVGWSDHAPEQPQHLATLSTPAPNESGDNWNYRAKRFNSMTQEIESRSKFKWSGTSEILLLTCAKLDGLTKIDFATCINLNVSKMLSDGTVTDIGEVLEQLSRAGKASLKDLKRISNRQGLRIASREVAASLMSRLPFRVDDAFVQASHYAIRDLSLG